MDELGENEFMEMPKTTFGFETAWNSMKTVIKKLLKYILRITATDLEKLFASLELPFDIFQDITELFSDMKYEIAADFLITLKINCKKFTHCN